VTTFESEARGTAAGEGLEITVSPLTAGRSGARVLRVAVANGRSAVVVKLDAVERLNAEMRKARAMTPGDQLLPMAVYSLEGVSVLVQQLVADADHVSEAAPSLKERLEVLAAVEGGRQNVMPPTKENLIVGLGRTFELIRSLNANPVGDAEKECWTGTEPIESLADLGIRWSLEADDGEFDVQEPLGLVADLLGRTDTGITVHGDLHAGNVLVPDDRVPRLIDFAQAGTGHPASDLVRLSSAVAYSSLRCLVPEVRMRAYFAALHLTSDPVEQLETEFAEIIAGSGAEIANTSLVLARDAALATLPEGEDGRSQYVAMVYLIGVQSLTRPEFQAGVVRAALGAIKPRLSC
jgi:hypothetical protein